ncbi:unnamed protein product [Acanthoscelides obtectus]|uniref:Uncharacterized protein n=1 Tax=Acanthoscelides obtectus TaxID=200917 RepID=A0A9P0M514_ACAOB|nr:unnamed protein product [Acanthoscelides obtectus]CAK1660973.1 hypothetical protein AOBTE_LOCUS22371 [Acanthoscelides obtectus]
MFHNLDTRGSSGGRSSRLFGLLISRRALCGRSLTVERGGTTRQIS